MSPPNVSAGASVLFAANNQFIVELKNKKNYDPASGFCAFFVLLKLEITSRQ